MKECPQCHKGYGDHLSHCQADGTPLVFRGSTVAGGPAPETGVAPEQPSVAVPAGDSPEAEFSAQKTPTSFLDDCGNDDKTPVVMIGDLLNQQQSKGGASRELMSYLEAAALGKEKKQKQGQGPQQKQGQGPQKEQGQGPQQKQGQGPQQKQGQGPQKEQGQGPQKEQGQGPQKKQGQGPQKEQGQGPQKEQQKEKTRSGVKANAAGASPEAVPAASSVLFPAPVVSSIMPTLPESAASTVMPPLPAPAASTVMPPLPAPTVSTVMPPFPEPTSSSVMPTLPEPAESAGGSSAEKVAEPPFTASTVEDLELEEHELEEVSQAPQAPPSPPSPEQDAEGAAAVPDSAIKPTASGIIDVSSVRLAAAIAPAPASPAPPTTGESGQLLSDIPLPEVAPLTSPLPEAEAGHAVALTLPVDHRRWIMMAVGLALVVGILSLYFFSTPKKPAASTTRQGSTKAEPAAPISPAGSSPSSSAAEAGPVGAQAEGDSPSADAGVREEGGASVATEAPEQERLAEQRDPLDEALKPRPKPRAPRKKVNPRPKKKLYRKTIDPFAE